MSFGSSGGTKIPKPQADQFTKTMNLLRLQQEFGVQPLRNFAVGQLGQFLTPGFALPGTGIAPDTSGIPGSSLANRLQNFIEQNPTELGGGLKKTMRLLDQFDPASAVRPGEVAPSISGLSPGMAGLLGGSVGGAEGAIPRSLASIGGIPVSELVGKTKKDFPKGKQRKQFKKLLKSMNRLGVSFEDLAAQDPNSVVQPGEGGPPIQQGPQVDQQLLDIYGDLPGLSDLRFSTPEQAFQAANLAKLTDVGGLRGAAEETLSKIIAPSISSSLTAAGLGRSGAIGENLANAAVNFALPIEQQRISGINNLVNTIGGFGNQRMQLLSGLATPQSPFYSVASTGGGASAPGSSPLNSFLGGAAQSLGGSLLGPIGSQLGNAITGGIGALGGLLGGLGGPASALSAAGVGSLGPASLLTGFLTSSAAVKNIHKELALEEIDQIVETIEKVPIYKWTYKRGYGDGRTHVGPVIEDMPVDMVKDSYLDVLSTLGVLTGAVKRLSQRIKALEKGA